MVERDNLAALGEKARHVVGRLLATFIIIGDDQADIFAGPHADIGDDDRYVLGVENILDRLGDHDAVAGENQYTVDALGMKILKVGHLFCLVRVATIGDEQVDVDVFGLPLVCGFPCAVYHCYEEWVCSPEDGIADLEILGRSRDRGQSCRERG